MSTNSAKSPVDKHPVIHWFIHNPVSANLLMMGILLGGLYMVGFFGLFGMTPKLRLEAFPLTESRMVTIQASLNGSNPKNVEHGVTDKIEAALQGIQGIKKTHSLSTANVSRVYIEASDNYDVDELLDDVQTQIDTLGTLPAEVEKIIVKKAARQRSILWVTLHGEASDKTLQAQAIRLKDKLLTNRYIEKVDIDGERTPEIAIEIPPQQLEAYGLTFAQVATAINSRSIDLSSGTIDSDQGKIQISIKSQADNKTAYGNIIIRSKADGSTLRLKDIASIKDGFTEQDIMVEFNGHPSMTLRLYSGEQANVIEADKAATEITEAFAQTLPANLNIDIWNNRVIYVRDRIDLFVRNSLTGVCLVFLLLTLFLNVKLAFWVALGIPISFAGALLMMDVMDISISLISLFAFIIVLGIVVDDAIVIGESIYSQKKRQHNHPEATLIGTTRVSTAATFGVLTTVAAFLPLTQVSGGFGSILGQVGWVVIFCLLFSLVESKLILPSHLHPIRISSLDDVNDRLTSHPWTTLQTSISHGLELLIEKTYLPVLTAALQQRYFTILVFIALFIISIGLVTSGIIRFSFRPQVESQTVSLSVDMDSNIDVETTMLWAKKAANALREADKSLMDKNGQHTPNVTNIAAFNTSDTQFRVGAGLASAETRTVDAGTIVKAWRQAMGPILGAKSVNFESTRRFSRSDISVQILSTNDDAQQAASQAVIDTLKTFAGVNDIASSQENATKEIRIVLKPEAATYGINESQLAQTVRSAFYGRQAERFQRGRDEVRVMLRHPQPKRQSITDLQQLLIRTESGQAIPISEIADLSFTEAPKSIEHINARKAITVYANVDKTVTSADEVSQTLADQYLQPIAQQFDVDVRLGSEREEDNASKKSMVVGFIISLILIYVLLAIPLKSYFQPIIIMSVIPFGIIGAILGHLILNMSISMIGLFGVIALSGVVVNDSLLLMTTIAQHRHDGMTVFEAVRRTGVRRFRPVILTSITTFAGLMPMLLETSFQAQFLIPMAVSLGFGILFATAITLILVPVLYCVSNDIKHLLFINSES